MPEKAIAADGYRAPNGIFYRLEGNGEPLLLLHGALAAGAMFDPLIALLRDRFRMLVPDLRGHGNSRSVGAPYDVAALAGDLDTVLAEAGFGRCIVMGYSHGGAVAQQFAHARPDAVVRLILVCTYARNVSTMRERLECEIFLALLRAFGTRALAKLIFRPSSPSSTGPVGLTPEQCEWLRSMVARNDSRAMCGVVRGLITFDSRDWLKEIKAPTLIVGGTHDHAVPRHHFDALLQGISNAKGQLVERADHTLVWTHTRELAAIMRGD